MRRTMPKLVAILCAVGVVVGLGGRCADAASLEEALPPDTLALVSFTDLKASAGRFKETALYRIWEEPDVQQFVAPVLAKINGEIERLKSQARQAGPTGAAMLDLLDVVPGQIAVAALPPQQGAALPMPQVVVVVEAHEGLDKIEALLQIGIGLAQAQAGLTPGQPFSHRGIEVKAFASPSLPAPLYYAVDGKRIIAANSKPAITQVMDGLRKPAEASLANGPALCQLRRALGAPPEFVVMVDLAALLKIYGPMVLHQAPSAVGNAVDALGLRGLHSIAFGSAFDGPAFRDAVCIRAPGERVGIAALLDMPMGDKQLLRRVPADALWVSAAKIELSEMYDAVMAMVRDVHPQAYGELMAQIAQVEAQMGLSIKGDILDSIGDEAAAYYTFPAELAVLVKAERPDALARVLDKAMAAAAAASPPRWRRGATEPLTVTFRGTDIRYAPIRVEEVVLWPSYALADDVCIVALNPQTIKSVMARIDGGILGSAQFTDVMAKLPPQNVSLAYVDTRRAVEPAYEVLALALQWLSDQRGLRELKRETGLDLAALPAKEAIARHLFPAAKCYSVDQEGFVAQMYGPWGGQLMSMLTSAAASAGIGWFRTSTVRIGADAVPVTQNNLKSIGLAVALYAADHDDALPPRGQFAQAVLPYIQDKNVFYHPTSRAKPREQFPRNIDYAFSERLPAKLGQVATPAETPLAWEKPELVAQTRHRSMLFCDGHVATFAPGDVHLLNLLRQAGAK